MCLGIRYILGKIMTVRMRVALKIAYDGRPFFGYQRQPNVRTVEGECIAALRAARAIVDPNAAFFRSASRTDRGVSAVGNVIAFDSALQPEAVVGAFNDRARGVWAWAVAAVPDGFHPRHAEERWYRYHLLQRIPLHALRKGASLFVGVHDFRSFTSDPPRGPTTITRIDVMRDGPAILFDIRAPSFRRAMVRRIVAAVVGTATGEISEDDVRASLRGERHDFGVVPAEPLVLVDVRYPFAWRVLLKPKVAAEWKSIEDDLELRLRLSRTVRAAVRAVSQQNG